MERFNAGGQDKKKGVLSKMSNTARATLAGAAMLGAVGASEIRSVEAQQPAQTQTESQESFDIQKEAARLISKIGQMKPETDDRLGGYKLYVEQIKPLLDNFIRVSGGDSMRVASVLASELHHMQEADPALQKNAGLFWVDRVLTDLQKQPMTPGQEKKLNQIFGN